MVPEEFIDSTGFENVQRQAKGELSGIIRNLSDIVQLKSIFGEEEWSGSQCVLKDVIIPALDAAKDLYENSTIDKLKDKIDLSKLSSVSSLLGLYNDYSFARVLWEQNGVHNL